MIGGEVDRTSIIVMRCAPVVGTGRTVDAVLTTIGGSAVGTAGAAALEFVNALVLDCGGQRGEHLLDVVSCQGRRFEELDPVLVRQLLPLVVRYHPVVVEVAFIAAQYDVAVGRGAGLDISHPPDHVIERRPVTYIVRQYETIGPAEEITR